jgi:hypothetical protein
MDIRWPSKDHEKDHHFFGHNILPKCGKKMGGKKGGIWCQNILIFSKKTWPKFEKVF